MAQSPKGLGRGLEALLGGFDESRSTPEILILPLSSIRPNPEQPRRTFTEASLKDLASSIKEQGVIQPVLLRPVRDASGAEYEIVAGERRWRAARIAGLTEIPAVVKEVSDEQSLALALIENLQREDLNPMEQAGGLSLLITRFGVSQEELARRVGMSRPAVANTLRLLQLPLPMQEDLASGVITAGHARALLSLAEESLREALWRRIREFGLSVREAEDQAHHAKRHGALPEAVVAAPEAQPPGKKARGVTKDEALRHLEEELAAGLGLKVKLAGTSGRGRITLHFKSQRELEAVLSLLRAAPGAA